MEIVCFLQMLKNGGGLDEEIESSLWSDEILWETPLDKVDVYKEFYQVMKRIESSNDLMMIESVRSSLSVEGIFRVAVGSHDGGLEDGAVRAKGCEERKS
ncbi:hypothetical protein BY996DRAFT_7324021 [Phakopsora pachyrhizi]|nr:hypothetical protein BY996DRAFT_7324021 [Phakopsora pachyrhizi]